VAPLHLQEKQTVRELISGRDVSLIFDGTSRLGEALATVICFCVGWSIKQKLVRLRIYVSQTIQWGRDSSRNFNHSAWYSQW
jgi:hypothetical protein